MSTILKRYVPLAVALLVLLLAGSTFAQDSAKMKDIWDIFDIMGKLVISFVAVAVPSLIAWQIHRYNKRQAAEDAARREHEQTMERERRQRDDKIRRLEMVQHFMPQLTSDQEKVKWSALALIKTLGDADLGDANFVKQISEAFMQPLVDRNDRGAIERLTANPDQTIASVASDAFESVLSPTTPQRQPRAAPIESSYYEKLSAPIELNGPVHYNDSDEHYGDFVVTRGSHAVEASTPFRIGIYLVSNEFFKMFTDAGGYEVSDYWRNAGDRLLYRTRDNTAGPGAWPSRTAISPGLERHPVSSISFFEAEAFVLSLQSAPPPNEPEWRWALPTEDMWEYAARSTDGRQYPWGSIWLPDHCNSIEAGVNSTTEVNQYPLGQSSVGCFDMAGNLWEFVDAQDKYPDTCIMRGGSFRNTSGEVRSHLRLIHVPKSHRPPDFGFRIAQVFQG
jgi:formylglycine-generating enzyme required for sulfatase activity